MAELSDYLTEHNKIVEEFKRPGAGSGGRFGAWAFIIVAALITGWQTHRISYQGMQGSIAFAGWEEHAAALTVILFEGTALWTTYCWLNYFRGQRQREIGGKVSSIIWGILAVNMLAGFAMSMNGGQMNGLVKLWAQFMFPLSIVLAGVFWKEVLHRDPISEQRIAALEIDAARTAQLQDVYRSMEGNIIQALKIGAQSDRVKEAIRLRAERAAMEHAELIIGTIQPISPEPEAMPGKSGRVNGHTSIPTEIDLDELPAFPPRQR